MPSFSQRIGLKPLRSALQIGAMDDTLRVKLWNMLFVYYFSNDTFDDIRGEPALYRLCMALWHSLFSRPLDTLLPIRSIVLQNIRDHYFKVRWDEVYELIEFVPNHYGDDVSEDINQDFINSCNEVLEQEMAGYRFVDGLITPITSPEEIQSVEVALGNSPNTAKEHLKRALELLSDRNNPDFRNSIKESISAVEALSQKIIGGNKGILSQALKKIEDSGVIEIHPALKSAFVQLYGYTSDSGGIRHALKDEKDPSFEDALFMLISCSAFINYLLVKSEKAGLELV